MSIFVRIIAVMEYKFKVEDIVQHKVFKEIGKIKIISIVDENTVKGQYVTKTGELKEETFNIKDLEPCEQRTAKFGW